MATNRQHTRSTAGLRFVGRLEVDGRTTVEQPLVDPGIEPGGSATLAQPSSLRQAGAGRRDLADRPGRAGCRRALGAGRARRRPSASSGSGPAPCRPLRPLAERSRGRSDDGAAHAGPATFDPATGRLRSLHGLAVDGPRLELWRAPTDNDRSRHPRVVRAGRSGGDRRRGSARAGSAERWQRARPHRLATGCSSRRAGGPARRSGPGSRRPTADCSSMSTTAGGWPTTSGCGSR